MTLEITGTESEWISALEPYQATLMAEMIAAVGGDHEAAVNNWLAMATGSNLAPFSTSPFGGSDGYARAFWNELFEFICGDDEKYADQRTELTKELKVGRTTVVAFVAATLSPPLGLAGPLVAPAVAIALLVVATVGKNAFCLSRREALQNALGQPDGVVGEIASSDKEPGADVVDEPS